MADSRELLQRLVDLYAAGGSGGGAVTTADGADVTQGAVADAAVAAGASGTISAKFRRLTTDIGSLLTRWPAALGGTTSAASLPVVLSSDGPFALQTGSITETAPATDTASSGLNGRLQRIAQRLTTQIGLVPASLGAKTSAASFSITAASDEPFAAVLGVTTGTKVVTDATGTVQQYLRGLVSRWADALGAGTAAAALRTTLASNDPLVTGVGSTQDSAATTDTGDFSLISLFKRLLQGISSLVTAAQSSADVPVSNSTLTGVAHDAADSGNPVKVGTKAVAALPAAVTAGDRANMISDLIGRLITSPFCNPENIVSGAITSAMTGTTSTSLVASPSDATLRNYITTIIVSNAHATVGTDIIIQDGSGGTTLMTIPAAAVYGGAVINLPVPLRQPTLNTALYCANVTTGASTKVSAVGFKAP